MKYTQTLAIPAFVGLVGLLTGCGGGGGSSPAPAPLTAANTSSAHYLPLAQGNTWTFTSGGRIVDEGPLVLSCTCPDNGGTIERVDLFAPGSSSASASFFFAKYTPPGATSLLTALIGAQQGGASMAVISNTQFPYGLPIMDDSPLAGEQWSDGVGDTSTITTTGGTMTIANNQQVTSVATDALNSTGSASFTWSFAKGVGFTAFSQQGQTTTLSSFTINALQSTSIGRRSALAGPKNLKAIHVASFAAALFPAH